MEQTLGKRISEQRKRLSLTQDQLAEKLGVTAQAVSKWENDQSCPDISTLPRLADIFNISVDTLLGRNAIATLSQEAEPQPEDKENHGWEFTYKSGRKAGITLAIYVLALGGQLLVGNLLSIELSVWTLLWTTALVVWGSFGIFPKFSFFRVSCLLVGCYAVLEHWQVMPAQLEKNILFPLCLILLGISILIDVLKKKDKSHWSFHPGPKHPGKHGALKIEKEFFQYNNSFGEETQCIHMSLLRSGEISVSFGDYTVDLSGIEAVADRCVLDAHCSFGELTLLVPRRFSVRPCSSTAFADVSVEGCPDTDPSGEFFLDTHASFAEIVVRYV